MDTEIHDDASLPEHNVVVKITLKDGTVGWAYWDRSAFFWFGTGEMAARREEVERWEELEPLTLSREPREPAR